MNGRISITLFKIFCNVPHTMSRHAPRCCPSRRHAASPYVSVWSVRRASLGTICHQRCGMPYAAPRLALPCLVLSKRSVCLTAEQRVPMRVRAMSHVTMACLSPSMLSYLASLAASPAPAFISPHLPSRRLPHPSRVSDPRLQFCCHPHHYTRPSHVSTPSSFPCPASSFPPPVSTLILLPHPRDRTHPPRSRVVSPRIPGPAAREMRLHLFQILSSTEAFIPRHDGWLSTSSASVNKCGNATS